MYLLVLERRNIYGNFSMKVNGSLSIDRRPERKPTSSCLIIPSKLWKNTVDCVKTAGYFQYPTTKVVWIRSKDWAKNVVSPSRCPGMSRVTVNSFIH